MDILLDEATLRQLLVVLEGIGVLAFTISGILVAAHKRLDLVGVVVVGINATEIVNAGVIALDAEATIETVADSIAAHPTLAEGFKEAGLVALGRPIHLPPMKKRS